MCIRDRKRVEHALALNNIMRLESLLKASQRIKLQDRASRAQALREALLRQETALFKLTLNAVIKADNKKQLINLTRQFKRANNAMLVRFEALPFIQRRLLNSHDKKELFIELGSLAIIYPFISSDMLESDGITLGMNIVTKAPIIYDYKLRDNYNIIILAGSGAGKSVTAKMIVNRLLKYNCYLYIIDPQGEYENLAKLYNAQVIRLYENKALGLDPFILFEKSNACNIIADIINAPEIIRKEIVAVGIDPTISISNINELYDKVSDNARKYLIDIIKDNRLNGSLMLRDRAILSLKGSYGSKSKDSFLITLALAKVWNAINNLQIDIPKILLIDEGWLLFNIPTAAQFINLIARVGRKLNVILLFLTQRPEDLIINEYGRALLDNSDTKILLRNDYTASLKIGEALQLSKEEQELLPILMRGEALLLTKDYRLRMQMMPRNDELRLFATNPN